MSEESDTDGLGTHQEVEALFTSRDMAEQVRDGLIGRPRRQYRVNAHNAHRAVTSFTRWLAGELEIVEMTLR